ncbi:MAG TPA: MlaD family protein [Candidatus Acidoferrales bacterium]|nr:MlaD family protein [Candidatus Acidoferrales bacterium]
MSRQAQVGAFAILALLLLFAVFYVVTDFGTRHTGYRIGVHFESAAGLHSGALVYFSGVTVGSVDSITLLPDNTVDVILAVNRDVDIPSDSKFLIQAPLTGDPNLIILPPRPQAGVRPPMLAREVLPVAEQPQGINTATIADLLQQGQGEIVKFDAMLSELQRREPKLLDTLQSTLTNANELTISMRSSLTALSSELQSSLAQASSNLVALTGTLNDTVQLNSPRISDMLTQFQQTAHALNTSMAVLESIAKDPNLRANVLATTQNIADTTKNIADITRDLRQVTGDPQTQAQLKNTVANLDATMQRADSLLGALGGKSSVYGVDANATPYPLGSSAPAPPAGGNAPPSSGTPTVQSLHLQSRLAAIASNLIQIQLRISRLSPEAVCCPSSLFKQNEGPQGDLNAVLLPKSENSLLVGANDIGSDTTANLAWLHSVGSDFRVGGGVLYSQLGLLGQYNAGVFGLDTKIYDLERPEIDLYGNVHLTKNLYLFYGERGLNHVEHRFTYGLQTQFP